MCPVLTTAFRALALGLFLGGAATAEVSFIQIGPKLNVVGTGASETVNLDGSGAFGEVTASQNGQQTAFIGIRDIAVNLGAGDDLLFVTALQIGGSLNANMGSGNDRVDCDDVGGALLIAGNVFLKLGGQTQDSVAVVVDSGFGIIFGRNVLIAGAADVDMDGDGLTSGSEANDVVVGGNLRITSAIAGDQNGDGRTLDLGGVVVGGATKFDLGGNADVIRIALCHFARKFEAKLGGGDDVIDFKDLKSEFNAAVTVNGGSGVDQFLGISKSIFASTVKQKSIETHP